MAETLVALTYGTALYEAAKDGGKVREISAEMALLAKLFEQEEGFRDFLISPAINAAEKKQIIGNIFEERFCRETIHFLFILIDKERTWHLGRIARQYQRFYDRDGGLTAGKIYSAAPLNEKQMLRFEEEMSRLLRQKVELKNRVDPSLIGGVKIKVDSKLIDQSLRADLNQLLERLKQA